MREDRFCFANLVIICYYLLRMFISELLFMFRFLGHFIENMREISFSAEIF